MDKKSAKALGYSTGYGIADTQVKEARGGRGPVDCEKLLSDVLELVEDRKQALKKLHDCERWLGKDPGLGCSCGRKRR